MSEKPWTEEEIKILKENYNKLSIKELQKTLLPNKSISQIYNYAFKIGLVKLKRWTQEEINVLKEFYGKETIEQITKRLPGRSITDIVHKASKLGLTDRKDWTEEELNILKEFYPIEGIKVLSRLPGRNKNAVIHMARRLGLRRNVEWTKEEDEIIKKYFFKESATKLSKRLPGRTPANINRRAHSLGLIKGNRGIPWTQEEIDILKKYYGKISNIELLKKLPNRTYNAITSQASLLGLVNKKQKVSKTNVSKQDNHATTDEEQALSSDNNTDDELVNAQQESNEFPIVDDTNSEEPDILDINLKQKRKKKHIRKKHISQKHKVRKVEIWTEDEDEIVRTRFNKDDLSILASKLPNHTIASIRRRAHKLGVANNQNLINWTEDEIKILSNYYPIEGTAVLYRLKKHSLNSIKAAVKVLKIRTGRITEPWAFKEDLLACKYYLEHIDNWNKKENVDELLDIFISNGFLTHKQKTLHMKLANCSYIHTGIGLEHASKQNIKAYDKLTGNNWFKRLLVKIKRFFKRIFK